MKELCAKKLIQMIDRAFKREEEEERREKLMEEYNRAMDGAKAVLFVM